MHHGCGLCPVFPRTGGVCVRVAEAYSVALLALKKTTGALSRPKTWFKPHTPHVQPDNPHPRQNAMPRAGSQGTAFGRQNT